MRATHVHPEGNLETCAWALFGEQPGKTEIMRGKPFIGPAGNELNNCLNDAGLNRQQGYLSATRLDPEVRHSHEPQNAHEVQWNYLLNPLQQ